MLRSEAIARLETGVLANALWPGVSKHDPAGAAVRAIWTVLRDAPPAAPLLRTRFRDAPPASLMLRSEAIARRETGVLANALWPRVSKHDPVRAIWSVLRDAPPAAPLVRTRW
jgi:hypothetical protein